MDNLKSPHATKAVKGLLIAFIGLMILSSAVAAIISYNSKKNPPLENIPEDIKESATSPVPIATTTSQTPKSETSYAYLFQSDRGSSTSNIVGYFGRGAFGWYVPDWLPVNWTMVKAESQSEDMVFAPKIRENPADFSDISIIVKPSDEKYNAGTLYEAELKQGDKSTILISEVLLNKHENDILKILMETDTRIYHVERKVSGNIRDTYYIDGKGKTVVVTFEAREDIFPQFAESIRDMVEGMGELKPPQG